MCNLTEVNYFNQTADWDWCAYNKTQFTLSLLCQKVSSTFKRSGIVRRHIVSCRVSGFWFCGHDTVPSPGLAPGNRSGLSPE